MVSSLSFQFVVIVTGRPFVRQEPCDVTIASRKIGTVDTNTGRYHSIWATCVVKFRFFGKNPSGPFIHITWYYLNCQKMFKGALFRGF